MPASILAAVAGAAVNQIFKEEPKALPKARDANGNIMDSNYYTEKSNEQLQLMKDNRQANQAATGLPSSTPKEDAPNPYEQPQQQMIQDPRKPRSVSPAAMAASSGIMGRIPS